MLGRKIQEARRAHSSAEGPQFAVRYATSMKVAAFADVLIACQCSSKRTAVLLPVMCIGSLFFLLTPCTLSQTRIAATARTQFNKTGVNVGYCTGNEQLGFVAAVSAGRDPGGVCRNAEMAGPGGRYAARMAGPGGR